MTTEGKMVLSARETATYLGVSYNHVLTCLQEGLLPGVRLGDKWLILRARLDDFLNSETGKTAACSEHATA